MSVAVWNCNGLSTDKRNDSEFCKLISKYDIVFLLESWTSADSDLEIDGYKVHNVYRKFQHRNARRSSGGIVILYRESIADGLSILKNHHDTIIWIKLDSIFFKTDNDIHICGSYIWGQDSPAYNFVNVNLFSILEEDINYYQSRGTVFVAGDMNSRVGIKPDYISYDRMNSILDGDDYVPDLPLDRVSMDKQCNNYGIQMLDMCKSTGLSICNGRLENKGSYTYCGPNGSSVIDYLICRHTDFQSLLYFDISDFNMFSDHAILEFGVKVNDIVSEQC